MSDRNRLSKVFVEVADTLVADFDVVDFLTMLADRCVELMSARQAGVLLADESGNLHSVASSDETARLLDLFELQNQQGPCLDCYRTGEQIVNQTLREAGEIWPIFATEALRLGFVMVHALPMRLRGSVIGAVNIFSTSTTPLAQIDLDVGQALADIATVGLLHERSIREARVLNEQLQVALTTRIIIEQAKGMLAERLRIEMNSAFEILRRRARRTNTRLSDVAQALLDGSLDAEELSEESSSR